MKTQTYHDTIKELEEELSLLKAHTQDFIELSERAIGLCDSVMIKFRNSVLKNGFSSEDEEIYFFKHIKSKVYSKFIFYTEVYNIETHRPNGGTKIQLNYLREETTKYSLYLKENSELYQYYKTQKTHSDHIYFLRGNLDTRIHEDNIACHLYPDFSTSYDKTFAKIMAYEQLKRYLGNEIHKLKGSEKYVSTLRWTGKKVHAIVLIYALHFLGVINNGQADISEISRGFEKMFNLDLKNLYSSFNKQIKGKKNDRAEFLRKLLETFEQKMDESDE